MIRRLAGSRRSRIVLAVAGLLGAGWGGFEGVMRSDWLAERLRTTMLRELEAVSGGSVSIDGLRFGDSRLSFEIAGLEIRSAGDDEAPFLTVPSAVAQLGWRSLAGGRTHIETLSVRDPHLRVMTGGDGATSLLLPGLLGESPEIEVGRFELTGGSIDWNGEPIAVEFSGSGLEIVVAADPETGRRRVEAGLRRAEWGPAGLEALESAAVSVRAVADEEGIEIRAAELLGEALSIRAAGRLRGVEAPRFDGSYSAEVQLASLADLADSAAAGVEGALTIEGTVRWDAASGRLDYEGAATASDILIRGLDTRNSFKGNVAGDLDALNLTGVTGMLAGGELEGSLELREIRQEPDATLAGTLKGVALETIAAAAGTGSIPWSGILDFRVDAEGAVSSDLVADIGIALRPSGGPSTLPVEGSASMQYSARHGTVELSSLELLTPNARLRASGTADGHEAGTFQVEAAVSSGPAVERVLAVVQPHVERALPMPDGRYSFEGELHASLGDEPEAILEGQFFIEDFEFGGQRWERLALRGALSSAAFEILDGQLADAGGHVRVRGSLPTGEQGPLQLQASGKGIDAAKLVRASGFGLPVSGAVALEIDASGTIGNPDVRSRIQVESPGFFGEGFDRLAADVLYRAGKFDVAEALLRRGDSRLTVTGSVDREAQVAEIDIESNLWPLDEFDWGRILMPGLTGTVQFGLTASGKVGGARLLRELEMDGHWEVAGLRRNDQSLGHWTGSIQSRQHRQNIGLDWSANVMGGVIRGDADVWQIEPASYTGTVDFRAISISQAAEFLGLPAESIDGSASGSAGFGGVIGVADTFRLDGTVDRVELQVSGAADRSYAVSNIFPMRWGVRQGALVLDSMALSAPGTDLAIDGSIAFDGDRTIDVALDGTLDLGILELAIPGLEASGASSIGLRVAGTLDEPVLEGRVGLADGTLGSPQVPVRLSDMTGSVRFEDGQGRIEDLRAASGGGTVDISGAVAFRDSSLEYRLDAAASDMRVEHPENVSSVLDGQFTLAGIGATSIMNGDVTVSRVSLREGLSFSDLFGSLDRSTADRASVGASVFENMQMQIHIGAISHLPVETDLMRNVEAGLDIEVMGTLASPSMLGTIGISQGQLHMIGTRYQITRGEIRFENPLRPEPVLNIELETRIRDTDLALVLSGPASALSLSYRSDPPLPFPDLINLIVVGKEPTVDPSIASQTRLQQQSLVQTGADALLSQALSRPLSRRLQRFFGVSRLKVDPQIGGLEANPSARISTEQQIADDLTLIYSYDLSSAQQQAIRIEWNPDRRWSFIVTRDQNGLVGSDVLYKARLP